MTPKQAIRVFTEKYPVQAINSLRNMGIDRSFSVQRFNSATFTESAAKFKEYLEGYVAYKINGPSDPKLKMSDDLIMEKSTEFIGSIFTERSHPCPDAIDLVGSYLEELDNLDSITEGHINTMRNANVDSPSIGIITELVNQYTDVIAPKMDATMTGLLKVSGYTTNQILAEAGRPKMKKVKQADYFL